MECESYSVDVPTERGIRKIVAEEIKKAGVAETNPTTLFAWEQEQEIRRIVAAEVREQIRKEVLRHASE